MGWPVVVTSACGQRADGGKDGGRAVVGGGRDGGGSAVAFGASSAVRAGGMTGGMACGLAGGVTPSSSSPEADGPSCSPLGVAVTAEVEEEEGASRFVIRRHTCLSSLCSRSAVEVVAPEEEGTCSWISCSSCLSSSALSLPSRSPS